MHFAGKGHSADSGSADVSGVLFEEDTINHFL